MNKFNTENKILFAISHKDNDLFDILCHCSKELIAPSMIAIMWLILQKLPVLNYLVELNAGKLACPYNT